LVIRANDTLEQHRRGSFHIAWLASMRLLLTVKARALQLRMLVEVNVDG
jgi:hypothetical protein